VGPESSLTNSKKIEKWQNLRVMSFYVIYKWEKNSNVEKNSLPESPFTEMTYHVRGCMTSRLNELGSAMSMA
jgi:hypothetical protein